MRRPGLATIVALALVFLASPVTAQSPAAEAARELSPRAWHVRVREAIFHNKPRSPDKIAGRVVVAFVLDRSGNIIDIAVETSSGHKILDDLVVDAIKRSAPFPPPPPTVEDDNVKLVLPIEFR